MPLTTIDIRTTYTEAQEVAIIEAVQSALIEGFKIPVEDRHVTLRAHAPHRMIVPPHCTQPECYTVVGIDAFAGRSAQAKRNLYQAIVKNLAALGIPPDHIIIRLIEPSMDNWGIKGGQMASDVGVNFKLDV
jgi:phenylpyruvate tautomerase PptA (4-oxalocrotonate tautomerase family)